MSFSHSMKATDREWVLSDGHDRLVVEAALRGLVTRGLMITYRRIVADAHRSPDGGVMDDGEDDWWVVREEGRATIGLPCMTARGDD
jgi:hypothetical protein